MGTMDSKVALVTGATGGIGKAMAIALARLGATVVVVGRSPERTAGAIRDIQATVAAATLEPLSCDLSSPASVRAAATEFLARHDKLDVLVNAAGVFRKARQVTADGLEVTFATNVMGYFVLTNLLLDALKRAAPSRVVNIASKYGNTKLNFDDLQTATGKYSFLRATPPTMLARVLFTQALAEKLQGTGVIVCAVHPGLVKNTDLLKDIGGIWMFLTNMFGKSAEVAVDTAVWLATAPESAPTGKLWANRKMLPTPGMGSDPAARQRLWDACVAIADGILSVTETSHFL
jgi:NAD(P)-dependent dehydrogenase (short-subunit alcohol dehydrogenase family)